MLPSTVPRTFTDFARTSPRILACSPTVNSPVELIVPSTSPSIRSELRNLTVPLIDTPPERRPPGCVDADGARLESELAARAGSLVGAAGSCFRLVNIAIPLTPPHLDVCKAMLITSDRE